uniref:Integrase catalytic domain-containing protein n=2 Tax=Nicotiana TaxID=4085 RepID=A0A1S4ACI9_TOBAC|nr:PREDICTED: uncharacterized protein LOC104228656 [Nicotiana sylvestris]XP_016474321.1 PREDICTED: uncharacterized protein LOC107796105 [Nicotiana tabacum]
MENCPRTQRNRGPLRTKVARFSLDENKTLYRRTFDGPLAVCLGPGDTDYVLREIHAGICGNNSGVGADALVQKVIRAGYYWDSMEKDTKEFVRKCDKCQRFAPIIHQSGERLHSVILSLPFMKLGMDIIGPLPMTPGKITCDNGKQFIGSKATQFLEDHKIKRILSTPYHACAIGQAESTNKTIIQSIKKKLESTKGKWREILPEVLWACRTTSKSSTGETPVSLVYDTEDLITVEVGAPRTRVQHATESSNDEAMTTTLKMLDERWEASLVRMAAQKQRIERYYNRRTNFRYFGIRDLVLRKVTLNTESHSEGKLGQNWERPYRVLGVVGKGSYKLGTMEGEQLPSNWNISMKK